MRKIERDAGRFRQIVRGKIKSNLRKYITNGELIGRTGGDFVSIPLPRIDLPEFRYGTKGSGGVGQGPGAVGKTIGRSDDPAASPAVGDAPGRHILEVELTLDELAQLLGEELELPRIEPRGKSSITTSKDRYSKIRQSGPESLRHFKRTFKNAIKRQVASRTYDPTDPIVIPIREDRLYRSWTPVDQPVANAVVFYLMDVSGSMTDEQKEIVRIEAFWIDTWLKSQYESIVMRYIIHDAAAREVDQSTFYRTRESGGTKISSAYALTASLLDRDHPASEWNIYVLHFSDGDNWGEDNRLSVSLLREALIPRCNLFGYGQVDSPYGSGEFLRELQDALESEPNVVLSEIRNRDGIFESIKKILGKGR
ncbi:MAG: DUF444 family protein [Isosphaeraceae bacterium]|nr:DUF444 family protein [Isosphaeraceae bacterium]